jgi:peptide/nickel transport system substrate-binding protein
MLRMLRDALLRGAPQQEHLGGAPGSHRGLRSRRRRRRGGRTALAALLLAASPALAAPQRPPDELAIGISSFTATLHPAIDLVFAKSFVLGMARRPMTLYDRQWHLSCMLCVTLPSFENGLAERIDLPNGQHGVRLTYTLRPNARWGDGVPVTTDDVLFTYEVGRDQRSGITDDDLFRHITKVTAKDAKTFVIERDKLTFDYAQLNDFEILPAHLERAAFADPAQYRIKTLYDTDPTNPGLYFGPYRITEEQPGSHIVLERNATWWGKPGYFRRIVVWTVENTATLQDNLLSGGVDMVPGEAGFPLAQALAFEKQYGKDFAVIYKTGLAFTHVDLNLDNPILADRRVRQALLYGIDRSAISTALFDGRNPVADSFVSPLDWVYAKDVPHYEYDPARARQLLNDAGWHAAGSAVRRNAKGEALSLELGAGSGSHSGELVEEVMQSQWRALGIDVRLHNQPARILFGDGVNKRKFEMAMFSWISSPENVPRSTLFSDEIPTAANGWAGQNYPGFRNPEADRLIEAIEVELDRDKRMRLWAELQRLFAIELPELPLYFSAEAFVLPKWLQGVTPTGDESPSTLWVEDWRRSELTAR